MKFGSLLRASACDLPEVAMLFSTYKELKKRLKQLPAVRDPSVVAGAATALSSEEAAFIHRIDTALAQMNATFAEREEEAINRLDALQAAAAATTDIDERHAIYKQLVDFHGEVLLLVHWSVLAYTATVKILKKHHKRTGIALRAPHLEGLLRQPFCCTELMTELAHKAEVCVTRLAASLTAAASSELDAAPAPGPGPAAAHHPGPQAQLRRLGSCQSVHTFELGGHHNPAGASVAPAPAAGCLDDGQGPRSVSPSSSSEGEWEGGLPGPAAALGMLRAGGVVAAHNAVGALPPASRQDLVRRTQVALATWSQLRATASTPSTAASLPVGPSRAAAESAGPSQGFQASNSWGAWPVPCQARAACHVYGGVKRQRCGVVAQQEEEEEEAGEVEGQGEVEGDGEGAGSDDDARSRKRSTVYTIDTHPGRASAV